MPGKHPTVAVEARVVTAGAVYVATLTLRPGETASPRDLLSRIAAVLPEFEASDWHLDYLPTEP
jgi:hypothetical protein